MVKNLIKYSQHFYHLFYIHLGPKNEPFTVFFGRVRFATVHMKHLINSVMSPYQTSGIRPFLTPHSLPFSQKTSSTLYTPRPSHGSRSA
jgi:hypothetical protein